VGVIFWIKINMSPTFVRFHPRDVGFRVLLPSRPTAHDSKSALRFMTVIRNLVKSSKFSESIICPVAPIFCENVAKIVLIECKKTDLGIQFLVL
jgi:hypothetical protein